MMRDITIREPGVLIVVTITTTSTAAHSRLSAAETQATAEGRASPIDQVRDAVSRAAQQLSAVVAAP